MSKIPYRVYIPEKELPECWYNIQADLPEKLPPPLNPATKKPLKPEELSAIFPRALIEQEMSTERYIEIPEPVREIYRSFRPSPLCRAYRLEKALDTPAKIYYKNEGVTPSGSHKLNTAIPQVHYNKVEGFRRLSTETGAGQWGSALSIATQMFGLECTVFMVRVSYEQKPYRKTLMQTYGAKVHPSPTPYTRAGKSILEKDPDTLGSLGIAISEAVEDAATNKDTNYSLGSVLNHVVLHQTIIGLEAKKQMEMIDEYPDVIIGCCGGGSNFAGIAFPFLKDNLEKKASVRAIAVEPKACPTLTKGRFAYDFGDTAQLTPLLQMYTLGHGFIPPGIHAGGLRYHGQSPLLSFIYHLGLIEAMAVHQTDIFESAILFARSEGILPAPESAHAIKTTIDEALKCKESGEQKTLLMCLSGHGHFDLSAYEGYLENQLDNFEYPDEMLEKGFQCLPDIDA